MLSDDVPWSFQVLHGYCGFELVAVVKSFSRLHQPAISGTPTLLAVVEEAATEFPAFSVPANGPANHPLTSASEIN